ncbi:MAG: hypothetical protein Q7W02_08375 [Candidatus Rokubacteria bacterium]|nr:hypothetical protein [Candidatus Rokubacteria bacterium]
MKKLINHPEAFVDETIEGILHGGDAPQAAATAWAGEDVEIEHAAHQGGPGPRTWGAGGAGAGLAFARMDVRGPGGRGGRRARASAHAGRERRDTRPG